MSVSMWFVWGAVCGAALGGIAVYGLRRGRRCPDVEKFGVSHHRPSKTWTETRNFLYYDGTVMPEIKEESNEQ